MKCARIRAFVLPLALCVTGLPLAYGQTTTPAPPLVRDDAAQRDQNEQRRQTEREAAQATDLQKAPDVKGPAAPVPSAERLPRDESPCFAIHGLNIEGVAPGQFSWLMDSLNGPDGRDGPLRRCIGAKGVALLLKRAQDAVVAHGYVTSRVLAPAQDLSSGELRILVVPGKVHAIRFDPLPPNGKPPASLAALPIQPGDVLNLRDIEQALENFKRVPTVEADIQITPASADAPDQSDLVIAWKQNKAVRFTLSTDDSGSKSSGRVQASATLSLDNPLGLSDTAYVTLNHDLNQELGNAFANTADGARGTRGNTLHYSLPLGYWSTGFTFSENSYYQSVPGLNQTYVYSGNAQTNEIFLSRMLYRDATAKTSTTLKAWQRNSSNFVDDVEVQVQRRSTGGWELGLNHKQSVGEANWEAGLKYKIGTGDFDAISAPEESFNEGTSRFGLWTLDASVNVPFQGLGHAWRYNGALRVQDNTTPLTPQDRFAIGGRYTIRGTDGESSLVGERGWNLRQDIGLSLDTWGMTGAELYWALDHGEVSGPSAANLLSTTLVGTALGLRGSLDSLGGKLQYDLFIGTTLTKPANFRPADTLAGFSLIWSW